MKKIPQKPTLGRLFNHVVEHFASQKIMSVDNDGECVYRSPEGLSCALGCLIDDDVYDNSLEGNTIVVEKIQKAVAESIGFKTLSDDAIGMLSLLQSAHDFSYDAGTLRSNLKQIAQDFECDTKNISKIKEWGRAEPDDDDDYGDGDDDYDC